MRRDLLVILACSTLLGLTGRADSQDRTADIASGFNLEKSIPKSGLGASINFSNGRVLVALDDEHRTRLLDASMNRELRRLGNEALVSAFSPDGLLLATGEWEKSTGSIVRVWDIVTGQPIAETTFKPHRITSPPLPSVNGRPAPSLNFELSQMVLSAVFSPNGRQLAVGGTDGVRLLEVATGRELAYERDLSLGFQALAYSPDGEALAIASRDGSVRLWNLVNGTKSVLAKAVSSAGVIGCSCPVAFSPDGKWFAAGIDGFGVGVWSMSSPAAVKATDLRSKRVTAIAFSPSGALLVSGGEDAYLTAWEVPSWRNVGRLSTGVDETQTSQANSKDRSTSSVQWIQFSGDGMRLAASTETAISFWRRSDSNRVADTPSVARSIQTDFPNPGESSRTSAAPSGQPAETARDQAPNPGINDTLAQQARNEALNRSINEAMAQQARNEALNRSINEAMAQQARNEALNRSINEAMAQQARNEALNRSINEAMAQQARNEVPNRSINEATAVAAREPGSQQGPASISVLVTTDKARVDLKDAEFLFRRRRENMITLGGGPFYDWLARDRLLVSDPVATPPGVTLRTEPIVWSSVKEIQFTEWTSFQGSSATKARLILTSGVARDVFVWLSDGEPLDEGDMKLSGKMLLDGALREVEIGSEGLRRLTFSASR